MSAVAAVDAAEVARRRNVASYGLDPERSTQLLALLRERGLTEWPPPPPSREQRRARWQAHVARHGLGPDRESTPFGEITPWRTAEFHPDAARRTTFYTGVGHPHHLNESPIPLFLSAPTLARYASRGEDFPARFGGVPWAGDSGAYAALMLRANPAGHPWFAHPDEYGSMWARLISDIGETSGYGTGPDFVGIQDWPCEEQCLRRSSSTVREHQEATLRNYLYLAEEFPFVPWLRTLQGWHPAEYVEHYRMYLAAGVEMTGQRVGIGSVCRRGSQDGVAAVLRTLAPLGMRMHGFGVSINALRIAGHLLASSDSQAWSATARHEHIRLPGCTHMSRPDPVTGARVPTDCRNCFRFAVRYREEVMDALRQSAAHAEAAGRGQLFDLDPPLHAAPTTAPPAEPASTGRVRRAAPPADQLALFAETPAGR